MLPNAHALAVLRGAPGSGERSACRIEGTARRKSPRARSFDPCHELTRGQILRRVEKRSSRKVDAATVLLPPECTKVGREPRSGRRDSNPTFPIQRTAG